MSEIEINTFLFPIGSVIRQKGETEKFTVMGYVTYSGDIFHVLLDEYMQGFDTYIEEDSNWKVVGVA